MSLLISITANQVSITSRIPRDGTRLKASLPLQHRQEEIRETDSTSRGQTDRFILSFDEGPEGALLLFLSWTGKSSDFILPLTFSTDFAFLQWFFPSASSTTPNMMKWTLRPARIIANSFRGSITGRKRSQTDSQNGNRFYKTCPG